MKNAEHSYTLLVTILTVYRMFIRVFSKVDALVYVWALTKKAAYEIQR
jgi:hypothetical protein